MSGPTAGWLSENAAMPDPYSHVSWHLFESWAWHRAEEEAHPGLGHVFARPARTSQGWRFWRRYEVVRSRNYID